MYIYVKPVSTRILPKVLRSFSKEATDFSDLLQGRDHPFVIGS